MALLHRLAWRAAHVWWRIRRPRTLGVRTLLLDPAGRVALIRHSYRRGWYLPGGGVDRGETMAAAARREVLEETGIAPITIDRILGLFHTQSEGKDDHVALFLAHAADGACQRIGAADPREIEEAAWFALDALPDDLSPATRRRIEAYRTGAVEGDQW